MPKIKQVYTGVTQLKPHSSIAAGQQNKKTAEQAAVYKKLFLFIFLDQLNPPNLHRLKYVRSFHKPLLFYAA